MSEYFQAVDVSRGEDHSAVCISYNGKYYHFSGEEADKLRSMTKEELIAVVKEMNVQYEGRSVESES